MLHIIVKYPFFFIAHYDFVLKNETFSLNSESHMEIENFDDFLKNSIKKEFQFIIKVTYQSY